MSSTFSETSWTFVFSEITRSAAALFLNGMCILLALQACYFLSHRKSSGRGVLIWAMVGACIFSILQMGYQVGFTVKFARLLHAAEIAATVSEQQRLQDSFQQLTQIKAQWDSIIIVLNNFAADSLFIYRCYAIWDQSRYKKQIISIPLILLLVTTISGVTFSAFPGDDLTHLLVVSLGAIATNVLLTSLTIGRIWWIRRDLRVVGETKFTRRYNAAIVMLLESSSLYFVLIVAFLFIQILGGAAVIESTGISILCGASGQLMNMLPALVVVRVSFARTIDVDPTAGSLKLQSPIY
ncbi:Rtt106 domain-containing protein [Mycena sanguinolenta]|uniref:Rtt106 domain-containing protein n=1 Tax=Mycena sanguinolenta TaxID=230812 RepID=A0A8H7CV04_9AGAR|nr:Rtt106 domain-containing protein [Mycena sanguinolenta]